MKETFDITNATVKNILEDIQLEIRAIAKVYDSHDLFGIAYGRFAEKIIDIIDDKYKL